MEMSAEIRKRTGVKSPRMQGDFIEMKTKILLPSGT